MLHFGNQILLILLQSINSGNAKLRSLLNDIHKAAEMALYITDIDGRICVVVIPVTLVAGTLVDPVLSIFFIIRYKINIKDHRITHRIINILCQTFLIFVILPVPKQSLGIQHSVCLLICKSASSRLLCSGNCRAVCAQVKYGINRTDIPDNGSSVVAILGSILLHIAQSFCHIVIVWLHDIASVAGMQAIVRRLVVVVQVCSSAAARRIVCLPYTVHRTGEIRLFSAFRSRPDGGTQSVQRSVIIALQNLIVDINIRLQPIFLPPAAAVLASLCNSSFTCICSVIEIFLCLRQQNRHFLIRQPVFHRTCAGV